MEKMSKKYESANISDVEEHISLKYDIKKRLGKGVSNFFSLFNLVEMNLFAQAVVTNETPSCSLSKPGEKNSFTAVFFFFCSL